MLGMMRGADGSPGTPARLVAVLVALGMLAVAAPVVVIVLRWLLSVL